MDLFPISNSPAPNRCRRALQALPRIGVVVIALAALDVIILRAFDALSLKLGALVGFELGLAIFLNAIGVIFVIDALEDLWRIPGLRWFYEMPVGRGAKSRRRSFVSLVPEELGVAMWLDLGRRVILLTALFFTMETVLFPLIAAIDLHFEAVLVFAGVLVQLVPAWRRGRRPAFSS